MRVYGKLQMHILILIWCVYNIYTLGSGLVKQKHTGSMLRMRTTLQKNSGEQTFQHKCQVYILAGK